MSSPKLFGIRTSTFYAYRLTLSIVLFLLLAYLIHEIRPSMFYNDNGTFRDFGVGYRDNTIFPIWIAFTVLAIGCYMLFTWYLSEV